MNPQLEGIAELEGTYVFDVAASVKAARLNRFFWRHREPAFRALVVRDLQAAFDELQLSEQERRLTEQCDWLGLIQYGVSFFVLEKFARVRKTSIWRCTPRCAARRSRLSWRPGGCRNRPDGP